MEALFTALGFAERDRDVYRKLLESGGASPNELARILKAPRASVYSALTLLEQRGLAYRERNGAGSRYLPHRTDALIEMVERENRLLARTAQEKVSAAEKLATLLAPLLQDSLASFPRVSVFEGRESVEQMLNSNLRLWRQSIVSFDFTWWGYQDNNLLEQYDRWFKKVADTHKPPETVKLFSNDSPTETLLKGKILRREIRLVPIELSFSSTIWILGNFVVTVMTRQEPHCAFEIVSPTLAQNLRTVFKMLWGYTDPRRR